MSEVDVPVLSPEALERIETAERVALAHYDRERAPFFPNNPAFSFVPDDIIKARATTIDYIRQYAQAIAGAHIGEYAVGGTPALDKEAARRISDRIQTLTDTLWFGYNTALFTAPSYWRYAVFATERPATIPDGHEWSEVWRSLTTTGGPFEQLRHSYQRAICEVVDGIYERVAPTPVSAADRISK